MKVVMPDGWSFYFYRNGNTETWRGNAGWMGETNNTIFTITALCGWRIKFDGGKIQEIDSEKNRTLTYRYNGGVATEVDEDDKPFVQVESNTATGAAEDLLIAGQRIGLSLAQRPRIQTMLKQNFVTGFDPSLNALDWSDGKKESFVFGTDEGLNPTLAISQGDGTQRIFTWDADTRQIKTDGNWSYHLQQMVGHLRFDRRTPQGQSEIFEDDAATGLTIEKSLSGKEMGTYRFVSGPLAGRIRKVEELNNGSYKILYSASYFPTGNLMRELFYPNKTRVYADDGSLAKETIGDNVVYEEEYDDQGRVIHILNPTQQMEVNRTYDSQGAATTQVFKQGTLLFTETTDHNNNLVSLNEGDK
jgi:YD repeat-containing protein